MQTEELISLVNELTAQPKEKVLSIYPILELI
ncbi:MAG: hypothetical protein EZS26_000048 [Candidatus Ordinivivax streblomastigis]|uniref:Uncharacterized protein n=1 Tax=Candidatus Ordinivivax streblomastigis TaxID=2540710 RepID=A0A5M8P4Q8_9BACT|nr:MAG: hypothetical protein EZS26_000048 [Candidatus Ordinivivax streblomastigis]